MLRSLEGGKDRDLSNHCPTEQAIERTSRMRMGPQQPAEDPLTPLIPLTHAEDPLTLLIPLTR